MSEKPSAGAPSWKIKKWLRKHPEDRVEPGEPEPLEEEVHEPPPAVKATKKKAKKKASKKKPSK